MTGCEVRVEAAILTVFARGLSTRNDDLLFASLVGVWRDAVESFGFDSGPARGALLDLVRAAWGDPCIHVCGDGQTWQPFTANMDVLVRGYFDTELEALVAALEAAP